MPKPAPVSLVELVVPNAEEVRPHDRCVRAPEQGFVRRLQPGAAKPVHATSLVGESGRAAPAS